MQNEQAIRRVARGATLHCLTGCAIGEVIGLVIGTTLGLHAGAAIILAIILAFLFGYGLSMIPLLRASVGLSATLSIVLAADTLSIATMEVVDNIVVITIPGAINAGLASPLFWFSILLSLLVAYYAAYPVNLSLLKRSKGHALIMKYHEDHTNHEHHSN